MYKSKLITFKFNIKGADNSLFQLVATWHKNCVKKNGAWKSSDFICR